MFSFCLYDFYFTDAWCVLVYVTHKVCSHCSAEGNKIPVAKVHMIIHVKNPIQNNHRCDWSGSLKNCN